MRKINESQTVERDGITYHQDDPFTGTVEHFHDNGQLHWRGNFIDGKKDGLAIPLCLQKWQSLFLSKDFDQWTASERLAEELNINSSKLRTLLKDSNVWD